MGHDGFGVEILPDKLVYHGRVLKVREGDIFDVHLTTMICYALAFSTDVAQVDNVVEVSAPNVKVWVVVEIVMMFFTMLKVWT